MTDLYIRPGSEPQPLPFSDHDETGRLWTDLANSEEGREATGWTELAAEKPYIDPSMQSVRWDAEGKQWLVEDLPLPPVPEPQPRSLGKLEFIRLTQEAGGMTDQMLVEAQGNPAYAAFWIKYQMASAVERDDPITLTALGALAMGGYLPEGPDAVLNAWPVA